MNNFFEVGELYSPKHVGGTYLHYFKTKPSEGFPTGKFDTIFTKLGSVLVPQNGILLCILENLILKDMNYYRKDLYEGDVVFLYNKSLIKKSFNYTSPEDFFRRISI